MFILFIISKLLNYFPIIEIKLESINFNWKQMHLFKNGSLNIFKGINDLMV